MLWNLVWLCDCFEDFSRDSKFRKGDLRGSQWNLRFPLLSFELHHISTFTGLNVASSATVYLERCSS